MTTTNSSEVASISALEQTIAAWGTILKTFAKDRKAVGTAIGKAVNLRKGDNIMGVAKAVKTLPTDKIIAAMQDSYDSAVKAAKASLDEGTITQAGLDAKVLAASSKLADNKAELAKMIADGSITLFADEIINLSKSGKTTLSATIYSNIGKTKNTNEGWAIMKSLSEVAGSALGATINNADLNKARSLGNAKVL